MLQSEGKWNIEYGELKGLRFNRTGYQEEEEEQRERGEEVDHAVVEPTHLTLCNWTARAVREGLL